MEKERLMRTLEQLHAELAQTDRVDAETLEKLQILSADIQRTLDEGQLQAPQAERDEEPITGLKDLLLKYEAEHPQLSASIGRVADALAAMGF
jgi:ABC-type transporter Mla subunit MlaD